MTIDIPGLIDELRQTAASLSVVANDPIDQAIADVVTHAARSLYLNAADALESLSQKLAAAESKVEGIEALNGLQAQSIAELARELDAAESKLEAIYVQEPVARIIRDGKYYRIAWIRGNDMDDGDAGRFLVIRPTREGGE